MPKRVKYRKSQRGSRKGTASRNLRIDFGEFGLQTLERAWITNTQLEAARVALTRNMKRKGKLWIRIFPDKSVTGRPPETRMGRAKGNPNTGSQLFGLAIFCLSSMGCRNRLRANLCALPRTSYGAHKVSHASPCQGR
jgi:ribosomal protein L16